MDNFKNKNAQRNYSNKVKMKQKPVTNQSSSSKSNPGGDMKKQDNEASLSNSYTRFNEASAKLQASVQRHVKDYESSEEEEELEDAKIFESVVGSYKALTSKNLDLGRTKDYLEQSFQSGGVVCLICIESIKRQQAIWNCVSCYSAFHMNCVQKWGRDSISIQKMQSEAYPMRDNTANKIVCWNCPKCRHSYTEVEIPSRYLCFCEKSVNPPYHPWTLPHSCGDICDKLLPQRCGHRCLLLCHPGPCPPCPKMVNMPCNCSQSPSKPMRCGSKKWCCSMTCSKVLECDKHKCEQKCHNGECSPCDKFKEQRCRCNNKLKVIPCATEDWQCDKICGKVMSCGYHVCEKICHTGSCGLCPSSGYQKCPCGSVVKEVTCPNEVATCGSTCNKVLPCGLHQCPHKCHKDNCPQCLVLVDKQCRCGLHTKQLPCNKQYTCDTKCKNMKSCGRHPCNKKCCDNDCTPCDKICGKVLQCGKHKCASTCHQGPCYPCTLTAKVTCRCGRTSISIPCGRQKRTKPPKCALNCRIPAPCGHTKENTHRCHFGNCPACKQICKTVLQCKHTCKSICHNYVPVLIPGAKADTPCDQQQDVVELRALPCPPCMEPVKVNCLGMHEETTYPCHLAKITSCGRHCGRLLKCQNHTCSLECHPVPDNTTTLATPLCETCLKNCSLPKQAGCNHPCNKQCHPAPCDPCQQFLKRKCHCGLTELYLQCFEFNTANAEDKNKNLSCKEQCNRSLECGHRCRSTCHSGECPVLEVCTRKTKIFCDCRRIKKEIQCDLAKDSIIQCDETCLKKIEEEKSAKLQEEKRLKLQEEKKNQKELEEYQKKFGQKKHKQRKVVEDEAESSFITKYWMSLSISLFVVFVAIIVVAFVWD